MNNEDKSMNELDEKRLLPRFPLSKIKKIAKCDKDYIITSNAAIVATAFATELFIQSLTEDGLSMSYLQQDKKSMKRNSKKKKIITANDNDTKDTTTKQVRLTLDNLIESVQRNEQFYFLEDVINKKYFNNDSKSIKKDKSATTVNMDTKHTKSNKQLDRNQSVLPFGVKKTTFSTLQGIENSGSESDELQEENEENILDGVEEEDDEEEETNDQETLYNVDVDSEVELQREIERMNTVEDVADGNAEEEEEENEEEDDDSEEKIRSRERLMGREETTEEVFE